MAQLRELGSHPPRPGVAPDLLLHLWQACQRTGDDPFDQPETQIALWPRWPEGLLFTDLSVVPLLLAGSQQRQLGGGLWGEAYHLAAAGAAPAPDAGVPVTLRYRALYAPVEVGAQVQVDAQGRPELQVLELPNPNYPLPPAPGPLDPPPQTVSVYPMQALPQALPPVPVRPPLEVVELMQQLNELGLQAWSRQAKEPVGTLRGWLADLHPQREPMFFVPDLDQVEEMAQYYFVEVERPAAKAPLYLGMARLLMRPAQVYYHELCQLGQGWHVPAQLYTSIDLPGPLSEAVIARLIAALLGIALEDRIPPLGTNSIDGYEDLAQQWADPALPAVDLEACCHYAVHAVALALPDLHAHIAPRCSYTQQPVLSDLDLFHYTPRPPLDLS